MKETNLALVLQAPPAPRLALLPQPVPELQPGEARVRLLAAALNHRDHWIRLGQYAGIITPCVMGSDGCGVVEAVASPADEHWLGQEVVINPNNNWGANPKAQGADYNIRGVPTPGTFQQYLVLPVHRLHKRPAHLSAGQAAALPLGGLTAYSATLLKGQPQPGQRVLVTGIGGGVAQLCMLLAQSAGATVWVTSGDDAKLARAKELGASGGVNYRQPDWARQLKATTRFSLIVDGTGGAQLNYLIELLAPAGSLVLYGATAGLVPELNLRKLFWQQNRLQGSTMGSDAAFAAMLAYVNQHKLVPPISSVRPFTQIIEAMEELARGKQFGKLVVQMD